MDIGKHYTITFLNYLQPSGVWSDVGLRTNTKNDKFDGYHKEHEEKDEHMIGNCNKKNKYQ